MNDGSDPIRKRKAWIWQRPAAPGLADLMAGGEARRRFLHYWITENRDNALDLALFFGLKLLPAGACSALGAWLGRTIGPRSHRAALERARANLEALRPDADAAQIDRLLTLYLESQGRQMTEYSVLRRVARNRRRIRFEGTEGLVERCAGKPVIFVGMHISNWEVMWHCLVDMGLAISGVYEPPRRRSRHFVVRRVRERGGVTALPPGKAGVRPALRLLQEGGNFLALCDESVQGEMRAPLFGAPAHFEGNYAFVARLARRTDALICPVYVVREGGTRFTLHALPMFELPPAAQEGEAQLKADVLLLNSVVEPVIRQHPEQWYFIDHRMRTTA